MTPIVTLRHHALGCRQMLTFGFGLPGTGFSKRFRKMMESKARKDEGKKKKKKKALKSNVYPA